MDRRGHAKAAGRDPDDFAAAQAKVWTDGLAGWGYGPDQINALRDARLHDLHPRLDGRDGAEHRRVAGPARPADAETVADEIEGFVSGLLGLVGIDADPLSSREHILLANLIQHGWAGRKHLDLPTLVGQVQQPPLKKLGVFELDEFFPAKDRRSSP